MRSQRLIDALVETHAQRSFYLFIWMSAVTISLCGMIASVDYWPLLLPGSVILVIGCTALLRAMFEGGLDRSFFDPRVMSWGYVIGGGICLPVALWFAGRGYQGVVMTDSELFRNFLVSILVGFIAAVMFRRLDAPRYKQAEWESALWSPTKLWIDFVVIPAMSAMLMWLLAPQIVLRLIDPSRADQTGNVFIALLFLAFHGGLLGLDQTNPPDPTKQHRRWDKRRFSPIV